MMSNRTEPLDHDELDLLLPWFVNGTLGHAEQSVVERHVADCEDCRRNIDVLMQMQASANREAPSPIVPRQRFDELIDLIESERSVVKPLAWMTPRAAVAAIAIVLAGVLVLFVSPDSGLERPLQFETATSANHVAASDYVVAIEFEPETTAAGRQEIIAAIGGTEIGAGEKPDTFRVAVSVPATTVQELSAFTEEVATTAGVVSVRVVAVQLPVE